METMNVVIVATITFALGYFTGAYADKISKCCVRIRNFCDTCCDPYDEDDKILDNAINPPSRVQRVVKLENNRRHKVYVV